MPSISKIRFANVVYEGGEKRYNDEIFLFDGHNAAVVLENGGGKTVFIHTAMQAIAPHSDLAGRKIKNTLSLANNTAHVAIEWILQAQPRRYAVTAVSLYLENGKMASHKYTCHYPEGDHHSIEHIPFSMTDARNKQRPATAAEINDYYVSTAQNHMNAQVFTTIDKYSAHLEEDFKIVASEWQSLVKINSNEGDAEAFFEHCRTTGDLVNKLLIPTVQLGMSGNGVADFVKLFEEKRTHFKKYKQLKDQIEENRQVEQEISRIMKSFEALAIAENEAVLLKQRIKSVYNFAVEERNDAEGKFACNRDALTELDAQEESLSEEKKVLEISFLQQKFAETAHLHQEQKARYDTVYDEREESARQQEMLKFLRDRRELEIKNAELRNEELKLQSLDEDEDAADIESALDNICGQLLSVYREREEYLEQVIFQINNQINAVKQEMESVKAQEKQASLVIMDKQEAAAKIEATMDMLAKDLEDIAGKILLNLREQTVPQELPKWKLELIKTQEQHTAQGEREYELNREKTDILPAIEELRKTEKEIGNLLNQAGSYVAENERKENQLAVSLQKIGHLRSIASVYSAQGKIETTLGLELEKKRKDLQEARLKERIALRLLDTYRDSDTFTADPLVQDFIGRCDKPVESGVEYARRLMAEKGLTQQELFKVFPLWQMSLIVQSRDKDYVMEKLSHWCERLTHPFLVLTAEEARFIEDESFLYTAVLPEFWPEVITKSGFINWKDNIRQRADEAGRYHEDRELDYRETEQLNLDFTRFLDEYPYDRYDTIRQEKLRLETELAKICLDITACEKKVKHIDEQLISVFQQREQLKLKIDDFERKIAQAVIWQQKEQERSDSILPLKALRREIALLEQTISSLAGQARQLAKTKEGHEALRDEHKEDLYKLRGEELFVELQKSAPVVPKLTEAALKNERRRLLEKLNKINYERNAILDAVKRLNKEIANFTNRLKEYDVTPDTGGEFPPNGDILLRQLARSIKELDTELKKQGTLLTDIDRKKHEAEVLLGKANNEFADKYQRAAVPLTGTLTEVAARLNEAAGRLAENKSRLTRHGEQLAKLINELSEVVRELERHHMKYGFLSEDIMAPPLSEQDQMNFPYNRSGCTTKFMSDMETMHQKVMKAESDVQNERLQFERFCQSPIIKNEKMRQTALNGIRHKSTHQEMREWESLMKTRIAKAIAIAEEHMREHNEDIKHFINQLHLHLTTICDEMAGIEKMTRVKVDDTYKSIYAISVPTWDETEAKQRLLNHIEWMTERLAGDDYKTEEGSENNARVRQDLEKWLHPRQLLTRVTSIPFRVQVRKVSNDNRISNALTDWTSSNSWSGGEKWSKNMALFLGIQSYLAEKRQHIARRNFNSRTVILDNPFGKASSSHVLEPVFFIAEKLGFQVIALTAHAEGRFLRDYFPIIYSCRLRESIGGDTFIVTKDKIIRYAFFKDSHPNSLERLGELRQVELF